MRPLILIAPLLLATVAAPEPRTIAYGGDEFQKVDVSRAPRAKAPLVVFIHGGFWSRGDKRGVWSKPAWAAAQGYAFASVEYRAVPQVTVADQATDIAVALARLRSSAAQFGYDPDRIALIGHSAGAHLAALVGTDEHYLQKAGVPLRAVRVIVLLDGVGYDVPSQVRAQPGAAQRYAEVFGSDKTAQWRLSPVAHAAVPNVHAWALFAVTRREVTSQQADELATALRKAGDVAAVTRVPNSSHGQINQDFGRAGDPVGSGAAAFLRRYL